ncbi:MAG: hypothetical protein M3290_10200 [Actinomycetota bacterium]|nr:hypothetical protein [Actinomycetota bacterium]
MEDNVVQSRTSVTRRRVIIGVAAGCVALPTFFLLTHGNAQTNPQPFAPPSFQAAAPEAPKADGGTHHPIETFQVFAPRDPFQPVVIARAGSATGSQESSTTQVVDTTTDGSSASGSSSSDGSVSVTGHRVKLIDTFTQGGTEKARVEVDGTVYTVAAGQTFATNFKLLSIQNKCITAFFGDDQFSLCEGEEILK